jgi:UPF0755 protein
MKRQKLAIIVLGVLALFLIGLGSFSFKLYTLLYQPMPVGISTEDPIIELDKTASATSFVNILETKHLIDSPRLFLSYVRITGLSHQLKAGIYQLHAGESAAQFLSRVVAGDVLKKSLLIVEGTTMRQISVTLKQAPFLMYQDSDWQTIRHPERVTLPLSSSEGLLLADTYQYNACSQARDVLNRAHSNLQHYLEASWQQRAANLPYKTPYDLLIAASIIEKETANSNEKRLISSVIVNRLRKFMPLQMDPTVIYGLGTTYTGKLTHNDLQIDSPYNTYRYRGLPPTPIAMVGKDAIDAAAHPASTNFLYFVARGDGTHYFSTSYNEQKSAIARYIKGKKHEDSK